MHTLSAGQEVANVDARLPENRSKSAFRHVASVAWQRHLPAGAFVTPYLVASRPRPNRTGIPHVSTGALPPGAGIRRAVPSTGQCSRRSIADILESTHLA